MNEALRGRRVLIVEDEPLIIYMVEDMLRDLGCRIAGVATSAAAALAALERTPAPDAAMLDLNLGGAHSQEIADALTARGIPFLIVTGYGEDAVAAARCSGPVLRKPFLEDDLARALAGVLGPAPSAMPDGAAPEAASAGAP